MEEQRLIEITSNILKCDGPLGRFAYINSLDENELTMLLRCMNHPAYNKLNIYEKILKFSQDYLESKKVTLIDIVGEESINDSAESYLKNTLHESSTKKR